MERKRPGFAQMVRAPFLSSIISPMIAGSLLSYHVSGTFKIFNFILVMVMGICLHIATNVYNDIYDTLQGTDKINVNRNEFSGGSGVLVNFPDLQLTLYWIARLALIVALFAAGWLLLRVDASLKYLLIGLYLLSAFFAKFYTAAPIKLAYRGWGEFSVWFAFGPMAILVTAVSQNVGLHPVIYAAMPITGISTLSILLIGQMIDRDADAATGKRGIAVRRGNRVASYVYLAVQLFLCTNVIFLALIVVNHGWPLLFSLVPYALLLPRISRILIRNYNQVNQLKQVAGLTVQLHLLFSVVFSLSILVACFVK